MRVASLLPSCTEIACALGARDALVGRSHECDFPPGVESLPVLTAARVDASAPSAELDRDVKALVARGLSIYEVDAERLCALQPDVVLTQTQCEVCAVTPRDLESALAEWTGRKPRIVSLEPRALDDVWADVERVGAGLDRVDRGRALGFELRERVERLAALATGPRARVACLEWLEPLMAAGSWIPELVALAGADDVLGRAAEPAPWIEWDALRDADPDALLLMPCGFDLQRTLDELAALERRSELDGLRAVREGRVYALDGNQYFNRPGPRLVESLEILLEILAGRDFGHRGTGWVPARAPAP